MQGNAVGRKGNGTARGMLIDSSLGNIHLEEQKDNGGIK
jgi:hypothetical protein